MARLKIEFPENSIAIIHIPVRITDINYGNHLGNSAIVEIIHEARVRFLKLNSLTEMDAGGISLIMSDLQVEYKNESFYGDVLDIKIYPGDITRVSFEMLYQICTVRNEKTVLIGNAKTTLIGYDYTTKK